MDLTLSWSLLLLMFISAISTQLPVIDSTNANGKQVLEEEALSLPSSSSDVSNTAINKEDTGKTAELSRSTSNTTPSTVTKVIKSSSRRAARRSRRRSSRRSARRRRKTKPSTRPSESTHITTQSSHRSKTVGHAVTQTASTKRPNSSETAVKVTTNSPLRPAKAFGRKSRKTTKTYSKITKPSAQEINKSPTTPNHTYGEPEITTRPITFKRTEHTFLETASGISGQTTFSNARTEIETDTSSPTPYQNETRIVVKGDPPSNVISLKMSNSPKNVEEEHRSSVTKDFHKKGLTTNTDNKPKDVISKTTASNQLQQLINNSKIGTTGASAVTDTSARHITSSTSKTLPFHMANIAKTSPMKHVEKTPAAKLVLSSTLTQPTQKRITKVSRQGPVPIASFLARVLPYLAGILGSNHVTIQRIRPETIIRGNEGSFDPTMQQMSRRRHFSIQSIPVQLNLAMPRLLNANRGQPSATFQMRSQMDIYRQRALCSKTPIRLRKMCEENTECPRKMECYSGKCCATSEYHAEMLGKMLEFMDRRRSQRFRII